MAVSQKGTSTLLNTFKHGLSPSCVLRRHNYWTFTNAKECVRFFKNNSSSCKKIFQRKCLQTIGIYPPLLRNEFGTHTKEEMKPNGTFKEMSSWQIYSYGGPGELRLNHGVRMPVLTEPRSIVIEVHASSVNPIDTRNLAGYGSRSVNVARKIQGTLLGGSSEFPLTLGRDFSGVVVEKGRLVTPSHCKVGDEVWGTLQFTSQGSHAQYTVANSNWISHKPPGLSHIEAASLPYAAATTWTSLTCPPSGLSAANTKGKRILVLGASGGVGTFAIQLLKAWGGHVTAVCGTSSLERVLGLGADMALDYTTNNVKQELQNVERFDIIFDCVGGKKYDYTIDFLREYQAAAYVSIVHPVLMNNDKLGLPFGLAASALSFGQKFTQTMKKGRVVKWGIHQPSRQCMLAIADLVNKGKISPVIEEVYGFKELPAAYQRVGRRHNKGKIIMDMKST